MNISPTQKFMILILCFEFIKKTTKIFMSKILTEVIPGHTLYKMLNYFYKNKRKLLGVVSI
jgi:hypothetical protein